MKKYWKTAQFLISLLWLNCTISSSWADTPLGWISSGNVSAYTTNRGEFEFNLAGLAVNDTIDFINARDTLIANNRRLIGDSGDLAGGQLELGYGITESLSVFVKAQQHDLTLDLGEFASLNLVDIDKKLSTEQLSLGAKWTVYQRNILNPNNQRSALSLELTASENKSDDFDVLIDRITRDNLTIFFTNPQTFSVGKLEDSGWKSRFIYTFPMSRQVIASIWAGYGESKAQSATFTDIRSPTVSNLFEQDFEQDETFIYVGASLNWNITPRLPVNFQYEYINIADADLERDPLTPALELPGFLSTSQSSENENHHFKAKISYWMTPDFNLSLSGNLYSNQFLGELPHYNNPLSGSFTSLLYGFVGLELGYRF